MALAPPLRWACRMRPLLLVALALSAPSAARAQLPPRSLGLELGFSRDLGASGPDRAPVSLSATWWIADDLDLTARGGSAFAWRSEVRPADPCFEAALGFRRRLAGTGRMRVHLVLDVVFVRAPGAVGLEPSALPASTPPDSGLALAAGAALELFAGRDVSVSATGEIGETIWLVRDGALAARFAIRMGVYF